MAENISTCSVDTVPIQIVNNWGEKPVTKLSAAGSAGFTGSTSFNTFITAVTEHLAAKLAQEKLCLNRSESQESSLIQFAHIHVTLSKDDHRLSTTRPLETRPSDVCRISSPWIDIAIGWEPVPSVRAIIRFSERQLLADQAVLAGASNVPPGVAMPLGEEYGRYKGLYIRGTGRGPRANNYERLEKPIEELVPPDILWLFKRTQFGDVLGSEAASMMNAMDWGADGYTKIVIALIDQCFASGKTEKQYNSVLDVSDLVPLEQYKIVTPYIETHPLRNAK